MTIYFLIGAASILAAIANVLVPREFRRRVAPPSTALVRRIVVLEVRR